MGSSPMIRTPLPGFSLALLWVGFAVGVSFLATPVKFLAPSLSLAVALDVGRQTFTFFNRAEWVLGAGLMAVLLVSPKNRVAIAGAVLVAALVLLEAVWMLPVLDARVGMIMAGQPVPPSILHNLYIGVELAKLALLMMVAVALGRQITGGLRLP